MFRGGARIDPSNITGGPAASTPPIIACRLGASPHYNFVACGVIPRFLPPCPFGGPFWAPTHRNSRLIEWRYRPGLVGCGWKLGELVGGPAVRSAIRKIYSG